MSPLAIIKLLRTAKIIRDYVIKKNNLDEQMEVMQKRVAKLESNTHPQRDFVSCEQCKCKIKEK